MQAEFAIIGGTGMYDPALLEGAAVIDIETPYGVARATVGKHRGQRIAFMPRHGAGHSIPPHQINYRANIWALKQLGVTQVLATTAVGSVQLDCAPGTLVVIDNFLDFTKSRPTTFFEDGSPVIHVDMTDPYCGRLRERLVATGKRLGLPLRDGGTYVCVEGPRFETPAEIRLYQSFGATVVGMTSVPEVVLAKEAELCYAAVSMVTNYGAGLSANPLTHEEVVEAMGNNVHRIRELFFETIASLDAERTCRCKTAVQGQTPLTGSGEGKGSH